MSYSLQDLRRMFYGGGASEEYQFLLDALNLGISSRTLLKFRGTTPSGAPTSGTYSIGDFIVTEDGHIFINTVAGSPGTWVGVSGSGGGGSSQPLGVNVQETGTDTTGTITPQTWADASTGMAGGAAILDVTFVAPSSGKARIILDAYIFTPGGQGVYFRLRDTANTVTYGHELYVGNNFIRRFFTITVKGLTPGQSYTMRPQLRSADAGQNPKLYWDDTLVPGVGSYLIAAYDGAGF